MDEAMHPLAMLAAGLYGEALPNQNGAPIRLVVPWKYGFKGIKSIVKIRFVDKQPPTTWKQPAPRRVRLLRERESRRRSPALEPGDASGASASSSGARRCCSTATPTRSRQPLRGDGSEKELLKPIVILKRIIFAAALIPAAALIVDALPGEPHRKPDRIHHAYDGRLGIRFLAITLR